MFVILIWFIWWFTMAIQMPKLETRLWPVFVEGLGIILTIVHLSIVIYKEKKNMPLDTPAPINKGTLITVTKTMAFFFLYAVAAKYIGFLSMTFVFSVLFEYWLFPKDKKWKYVVFAGVMTIVIWLFFKLFLGIPLPNGILI